jgi:two-component system NarL family response regulator
MIVDDHHLVRAGLVAVIDGAPGLAVVGEAASGDEALALYGRLRPDVTVMDVRLPGKSGIETVTALRQQDPAAKVLMLSLHEGDEEVSRALAAGALGYALKRAEAGELIAAIHAVAAGRSSVGPELMAKLAARERRPQLTPREQEVLTYLAQGHDNAAIGELLGISAGTVKIHVKHIFDKLGVHDRTHAIALALRRGLVHLD